MKFKAILLAAACAATLLTVTAQADISLTISPVANDTTKYLLDATGTGDTISIISGSNNGRLNLDGNAFITSNGMPDAGLTFGGVAVTVATTSVQVSATQYYFQLPSPLASGSQYSFGGGPIEVFIGNPTGYENHFIPGTYSIVSSTGIFGDNAVGTVIVNPVPEPATYAALAGLAALAFVMYRRRKA